MIIISDTSVISNLVQIERLELLRHLFDVVVIPPAVLRELHQLESHEFVLTLTDWISVAQPGNHQLINELQEILDPGESEAIALAVEGKADFLLIDELKGRSVAKQYQVSIVGILGLLIQGKQRGILTAVRPEILKLREIGFRMSLGLMNEVLSKLNELPIEK